MRYWIAALLIVATFGLFGKCQAAIFDTSYREAIVMMGEIESGDYNKFLHAVALNGNPKVLVTNGPGGVMMDALAIGEYVKDNKIKTIAIGNCYSGCAMVWAAGYRLGMMENAIIGIHGASDEETGLPHAMPNAVLGKYLSDCGFDYQFIMDALAGGSDFRIFGFKDIEKMEKEYKVYIFPTVTDKQIDFFLEM